MADFYIAMTCINKNKYNGDMGLFCDHIINKLWELIVKLFNSMIVHGTSSEDLNCGTMIPIPKNRHGKVNEFDNFQAICLQSVLCKIMDVLI